MITVELSQPVVMTDGYSRQHRRGDVVKIGRVWIDVQPEGTQNESARRRFRLDDQTDGSKIGSPGHFYTLEQWAEKQRQSEASTFLREQGITVEFGSPWRQRQAELADIIRTATTKETTP